MKTIHELHKIEGSGSDKGNSDHSFAGQNYLHYYERHFEQYRDKPINLLEIGVRGAHSVRLWRDYFPRAMIYGLDIDPRIEMNQGERIEIVIGDQTDRKALEALIKKADGFDIVIDDGSHILDHLLFTHSVLWRSVRSGGYYVFEDLRISYHGWSMGWPGMTYNEVGVTPRHDRREFDSFLLETIRAMDELSGDVRSMHCYPMVCFLEKI